jgi:aryl-alcohol dehydrogenase-like predicted oxidoreductase
LSGASSTIQLEENLKMNIFKFSEEELQQLTSFKIQPSAYWQERKQLEWN